MPHLDLQSRRPWEAAHRTRGSGRAQRRHRRGIVLIFVVVLLTLLAIMGTAYLATSRLDRQAVTGRGRMPGASAGTALLTDRSTLDRLAGQVEREAKIQILRDLFNIRPGLQYNGDNFRLLAANGAFRQEARTVAQPVSWYENYDATGRADPWLASLLPRRGATANTFVWPWISGPMLDSTTAATTSPDFFAEPFFSDPRFMTSAGVPATARYAGTNPDLAYPGDPGANPADEDDAVGDRHNVEITWLPMGRPTTPASALSDNVRVYPALISPGTGGVTVLGADADGDGIADSGLAPIALDPTAAANSIDRYLDARNGVVYYVGVRIVDNGAKINLATALDHQAEFVELAANTSTTENADEGVLASAATPPSELRSYLTEDKTGAPYSTLIDPAAPAGILGPVYGFFRADVGYTNLVRTLLSPLNPATDANDYNRGPAQQELRRLVDLRFPLLRQQPGDQQDGTGAATGADIQKLAGDFATAAVAQFRLSTSGVAPGAAAAAPLWQYRSWSDLLEQQVARRPGERAGYLWTTTTGGLAVPPTFRTDGLPWLGLGDTISLGAKGGALVNPLISPGSAESALAYTLRFSAPNLNFNGEEPWAWFPPNAVDLWFGWTQDFDPVPGVAASGAPSTIAALDAATPTGRAFLYNATNAPSKPNGTADTYLQRSPRALFTSYNGVTWLAPTRGDRAVDPSLGTPNTAGLPIGMPAYLAIEARDDQPGHAPSIVNSAIGADPFIGTTFFWYPQAKVSAATGTKEQLWRAYWSAMTQQQVFAYPVGSVTYVSSFWDAARKTPTTFPIPTAYTPLNYAEAFRSSDRYASNEFTVDPAADTSRTYLPTSMDYEKDQPTEVLTSRQMALLRGAVAACNTIDLRDPDNDITAMDVDLTDNDNTSATQPRYYARVYGTEKQLVISGIYMEADPAAPFVAVEIYNPSDVPIQLSAYRIAVMDRSPAGFKATGTVTPLAAAGISPIRLSTDPTEVLQPGGYVVLMSQPAPPDVARFPAPVATAHGASAPTGTPDVYVRTVADAADLPTTLNALVTGTRTYELVLARTRRADGVPFVDGTATAAGGVRNAIENEIANNTNGTADTTYTTGAPAASDVDVKTLVTLDAVDCRLDLTNTVGTALPVFSYQRQRPAAKPAPTATAADPLVDATARDAAWRCFYAGKFYDLRPTAAGRVPGGALPATVDYAWREIDDSLGAAVTFAPAAAVIYNAAPNAPGGFLAPAIPIQNFEPLDPYTTTNYRLAGAATGALQQSVFGGAVPAQWRGIFHLINQFPYSSPFARELDIQAVPYIGTYKVFRQVGAGAVELYEYVPLPMDAWAVASNLDPAEVAGPDQIRTFGRFDPKKASPTRADEWASNLSDFVTAREAPYKLYFPDVPNVTLLTTFFDTTTSPSPAGANQRYAQDGPINGTAGANLFSDVRYVSFTERGATGSDTALTASGFRQGLRMGRDVSAPAESALVQGVGNVNTMPQVVMRQYPWVVNPETGFALFTGPSAALEPRHRAIANTIDLDREAFAANGFTAGAATLNRQFGFTSIASLNTEIVSLADRLDTIYSTTGTALPTPTAEQYMRLGMLRPTDRSEDDAYYVANQLNSARISNLAGTRSDVFTVYVTVQAWTYNSNATVQQNETRLVGERRSSFVVDRSRITQTSFDLSDLIVLPIEQQ